MLGRPPFRLAPLPPIDAVQTKAEQCEGDERTGMHILRRALEAPTRQIAENSGADSGVVVEKMRASTGNDGYDAARNTYVVLVRPVSSTPRRWCVPPWRTPSPSPACCDSPRARCRRWKTGKTAAPPPSPKTSDRPLHRNRPKRPARSHHRPRGAHPRRCRLRR